LTNNQVETKINEKVIAGIRTKQLELRNAKTTSVYLKRLFAQRDKSVLVYVKSTAILHDGHMQCAY
jgi:hypothetical protein